MRTNGGERIRIKDSFATALDMNPNAIISPPKETKINGCLILNLSPVIM